MAELRDTRSVALVLLPLGAGLYTLLAVTKTPWFLVMVALLGGLLVEQTVYRPKSLRQRAQLLRPNTWD